MTTFHSFPGSGEATELVQEMELLMGQAPGSCSRPQGLPMQQTHPTWIKKPPGEGSPPAPAGHGQVGYGEGPWQEGEGGAAPWGWRPPVARVPLVRRLSPRVMSPA